MSETSEQLVEKLRAVAEPIAAGLGLELVDLEVVGSRQPRVCVFLDGPDGITVDHCASVSRALSEHLDEEEDEAIFPGPYRLEVSSPGLDRPFKTAADYQRNLTRRVQVFYLETRPGGLEGHIGVLDDVDEEGFQLTLDDGQRVRCRFDEVRKVHRSIEF